MSCDADDDAVLVRRELWVEAAPDELWEAVTEPGWLAPDAVLDVRPGGHGWFRDDDGTVRRAEVDEVEPGHRLTFRWWAIGGHEDGLEREVTLTVAPEGSGARLIVVEQPLASGIRASAAGVDHLLQALSAVPVGASA